MKKIKPIKYAKELKGGCAYFEVSETHKIVSNPFIILGQPRKHHYRNSSFIKDVFTVEARGKGVLDKCFLSDSGIMMTKESRVHNGFKTYKYSPSGHRFFVKKLKS